MVVANVAKRFRTSLNGYLGTILKYFNYSPNHVAMATTCLRAKRHHVAHGQLVTMATNTLRSRGFFILEAENEMSFLDVFRDAKFLFWYSNDNSQS